MNLIRCVYPVALLTLLVACDATPPSCSDPKVLEAVIRRFSDLLQSEGLTSEQALRAKSEMAFSVVDVTTQKDPNSSRKRLCEAKLQIKLPPSALSEIATLRMLQVDRPKYQQFLDLRTGGDVGLRMMIETTHARISRLTVTDGFFRQTVIYTSQLTDDGEKLVVNAEGLDEISFAVAYLVAAASEAMRHQQTAANGERIYKQTCAACHATGAAGAPKAGDKAAWLPRLKLGINSLYLTVLEGKGAMPPKGGNKALTDVEVRAAVDYLVALVLVD